MLLTEPGSAFMLEMIDDVWMIRPVGGARIIDHHAETDTAPPKRAGGAPWGTRHTSARGKQQRWKGKG